MRLLYAYFDFSILHETNGDQRGLKECGLNFSTTHNYSVSKSTEETENGRKIIYTVSVMEKPKEEQIPEGFWGSRIYNITAIVGSNGTGKSTLIHDMIRAVVKGLDPGVPFLLLFQETNCELITMYYGENSNDYYFRFIGETQKKQNVREQYPEALQKTKIMLIDNSLSVSSEELDTEYKRAIPYFYFQENKGMAPKQVPEAVKQFYNKSLFSSINYSNAISAANRPEQSLSADIQLRTHFGYESLQETRLLFDKFQQPKLENLKAQNYQIRNPNYVYVSAYSLEVLHDYFRKGNQRRDIATPEIGKQYIQLQNRGFWGTLLADALYSFYIVLCFQFIEFLFDDEKTNEENHTTPNTHGLSEGDQKLGAPSEESIARAILQSLSEQFEKQLNNQKTEPQNQQSLTKEREEWLRSVGRCCGKFIDFVANKKELLAEIFQPYSTDDDEKQKTERGQFQRRIDINSVLSDKPKNDAVIEFITSYRLASSFTYFLSFSSGLSSGEKNMLRMMTQFRYALDGPAVYPDDVTSEANTHDFLHNILFEYGNNGFYAAKDLSCDTLLLFLDEADLTYHPEWQRQFVSVLTAILPEMFRDPYSEKNEQSGCKDIQVILATHSPLMLSDFPKASTIYLKRNTSTGNITEVTTQGYQSTFGENIYTILKDSFFMDDSVGEFAKRKINDAAEWCGRVRSLVNQKKKLEKKEKELRSDNEKGDQTQENNKSEEKLLREQELDAIHKELEILLHDKEELVGALNRHKATAMLLPPGIIKNKLINELTICEVLVLGKQQVQSRRKSLEQQAQQLRKQLETTEQLLWTLEDAYESN